MDRERVAGIAAIVMATLSFVLKFFYSFQDVAQWAALIVGGGFLTYVLLQVPPSRWVEMFEEGSNGARKVSLARASGFGAVVVALGLTIYSTVFAYSALDVEFINSLLLYGVGIYGVNKGKAAFTDKTQASVETQK